MPEYDGLIIRPPSESDSLILQYTIGCSHNQCIFCPAYKQKQFRVRSLSEMEQDVLDCIPALRVWMQKGVTAADMAAAGLRVKAAGIKLSVTVLLGIGGSARSREHARATGRLLTKIDPDYVGALTTMVVPGTLLHRIEQAGNFRMASPFKILAELGEMLEQTEMRGLFFSNHASNYLPLRIRMPLQ